MVVRRPQPNAPTAWTRIDAALGLLVLIWGVNFAAIKLVLLEINVQAFAILRFGLATLVILAVVALRGEPLRVPRRQWPRIVGLGLVGHTLYQLLFTYGLSQTTSGRGAIMLSLVPLFVALLVTLLGLERMDRARWTGVALSIAGAALVALGQAPAPTPAPAQLAAAGGSAATAGSIAGDLLVLGSGMAWALYTVLGKPLLDEHSPLKLTGVTMAAGTIGLTAVGWPGLMAQDWSSISGRAWSLYVFATLGGLVVAYTIWYTAVQRLGGTRTAIFSNLVPVVALILGWSVLGERLSAVQTAGAALALGGVWLTRRRGRSEARQRAGEG